MNGVWLGVSEEPYDIINILTSAKNKNIIDKTITYFIDIEKMELIIYTDIGRLTRPVMNVKNTVLLIKDMINLIKTKDENK